MTIIGVHSLNDSVPWVEKYRPETFDEFVGNIDEVTRLENWLKTWNQQRKKVVLLAGPAGVGKTSVVYYLIKKYGYEFIEVNASDKRNKKAVEKLVGKSSTEGTVLQGAIVRKLVLVDEADGLFGNQDRGGGQALARAIDTARIPIICTANDPSASALKSAKRKMLVIEFKRLNEQEIFLLLQNILKKEKISVNEKILLDIVKNCGGDARSAINDLESIAFASDLTDITFSSRNQQQNLDDALIKIFQAKDFNSARRATNDLDVEYRELLQYVFEHAYKQASNSQELSKMYEIIAEADVYLSYCYRTQNWTFLKYFFMFISSVGLVKESPFKYTKFGFPGYWALMGRLRSKKAKLKSIASKSSKKLHCSEIFFGKEIFPYIRIIFNTDTKMAAGIAAWLEYSEEDIAYLTNDSKKLTNKILQLAEEAYLQMADEWISAAKVKQKSTLFDYTTFKEKEVKKKQDTTPKKKTKSSQASLEKFIEK
jgi:replication factor C large subunit